MACPYCGCLQSATVPHHMTVEEQLTDAYWRRRECARCGRVFATVETAAAIDIDPPVTK